MEAELKSTLAAARAGRPSEGATDRSAAAGA